MATRHTPATRNRLPLARLYRPRPRSSRSWWTDGSPGGFRSPGGFGSVMWNRSVRRLRERVHHEADVRVARERRRLEHALDDDRLDLLVDLEDDHAGEV